MKKYSIRQAILDAIDETDDTISRHMNTLIKWAKYCERAIGSINGYPIKAALFTVSDSEITQPDDCYRVLMVIPGDYVDEANLRYKDMGSIVLNVENISDDLDFEYVWSDLSYPKIGDSLWEELGNKVNIVDQYDDVEVTLLYQYIETDEKGYWLVNYEHLDAIKKFLIYMIAKKYMYKNFMSSKLTRGSDMNIVEGYKKDYSHAIRNARAEDNKESPLNTIK